MFNRDLMDILRCPYCGGKLVGADDENRIECQKCKDHFGIENGVPILMSKSTDSVTKVHA